MARAASPGATPAASGSHYFRVHHCFPADAGRAHCALYCDAKGACVDALTADGVCTAAAPPHPSPYVCEVRGGACVTARDP